MINKLRSLSDYHFERECGDILQTVFPAAQGSQARGKRDRAGVDHCVFLETDNGLASVFQCKGFDVPEMGPSQVQQCLHSIESFRRSHFRSEQYFLIVNRIVKDAIRDKLEGAVQLLEKDGKVQTAQLLDLEAFMEMVFVEAQRQVTALLRDSAARYQEQHRTRMEEDIYLINVPFKVSDDRRAEVNPLRFVEERVLKLAQEKSNKRSWTLVVGEFGFGKTSLALRLTEFLKAKGMICVYLPVAQLPAKAFEGEREFMWAVLQLIYTEEIDRSRVRDLIFQTALKEIFRRDKNFVLFLDGIDEHPICWREGGLKSVFGIFKTFNATCMFAAREEFLAERAGYFEAAVKGGPGLFILKLVEWDEALVLEYSQAWRARNEPVGAEERIAHFEDAVQTGRYVDFYGDIPKRPLFLKMLLGDVAKEDIRARNLSEIYTNYLLEKFRIDRETSASNPIVRRPLSMDEDYAIVCARLFDVMTRTAGKMYQIEDGEVRMLPSANELDVRACAKQVTGGSLDLPSILSNSVLVPVGRRNLKNQDGQLSFTFAHKSFQAFFLARYIIAVLLREITDDAILCASLPTSVPRFFRGLFAMLSPEQIAQARHNAIEVGQGFPLLNEIQ